jgi:hypothetical protein
MMVGMSHMHRVLRLGFGVVAAFLATAVAKNARADSQVVIDGTVQAGGLDHFFLPFTMPAGTAEIQIEHSFSPSGNILDFGLNDENGYRGWGGGLTDALIINEQAATRCYVPGPLTPGEWKVVVGKAELVTLPVRYHVVITFRDAVTLAPQTERSPYTPIAAISAERRWYAGDLHVHSTESGDAGDSLDVLSSFASDVGLDFVEVSDHNTITQMDFFNEIQAKHPNLLLIPGDEWTTYHGHGNGIGATQWVDHKVGQPGVTVESSISAFNAQGAVFSINHPTVNVGTLCIGCAWTYYGLDPQLLGGVEIESRGYKTFGDLFSAGAIALWEDLTASGAHLAALGGSDDHQGGQNGDGSRISSPTTYVLADELSVAGIVQGIKNRRTYVKLNSPADPAIDFESSVEPVADVVTADETIFQATVTGAGAPGDTTEFRWVKNGVAGDFIDVTGNPFVAKLKVSPSEAGNDRVRAEVFVNAAPTTVTSYLWLNAPAKAAKTTQERDLVSSVTPAAPALSEGAASSACSTTSSSRGRSTGGFTFAVGLLGIVLALRRSRRRSG